jgi:predicted permease
VRDNLSAPLLALMAIVVLVLIVACANIASLMLARAATRRRETAVCLAIGAGRWRLVWQRMAEALVIAAIGGLGGMLLAVWGTSVLAALISGALPVSLDLSPDARVLAFAALTSCATAVVFGFLPALRATRIDPLGSLRGSGEAARGVSRIPLGRTLVVTQIAVSIVLLVAAGLFVRSLFELKEIDPGFDADRVVTFRMTAGAQPTASIELRRRLYRQMLERAASVPGVEAVSASSSGVLSAETWRNAIAVEGFVPADGVTPRTFASSVTPAYFDVMRIAVLRGRGFTDDDHEQAPRVAVVSQAFARRFFGEADPIGRRVGPCSSDPCGPSAGGLMEIVGVTEDSKYTDLREEPRPMLYVPFTQTGQNLREIQVRTAADPSAATATIYRELASVDSRLAIVGVMPARGRVAASMMAESMIAKLSSVFGLLALALAGVGLYGLVAYMTTQRTAEIGIRIALGAERREVRRLVLRDTARLAALGTAIGLPAALAGSRLLSNMLYQVKPGDPVALSLSIVALSCVAIVAGYLPARRAAHVDPVSALRSE